MALCYDSRDDDGAGTSPASWKAKKAKGQMRIVRKGSNDGESVRVKKRSGPPKWPEYRTARGAMSKAALYSYFGNESGSERGAVYLASMQGTDAKYDCFIMYRGRKIKELRSLNAERALDFVHGHMGMEKDGYEVMTYKVGNFA